MADTPNTPLSMMEEEGAVSMQSDLECHQESCRGKERGYEEAKSEGDENEEICGEENITDDIYTEGLGPDNLTSSEWLLSMETESDIKLGKRKRNRKSKPGAL